MVRDAGSPSRMGKVYKVYPYTLKALLQAIDDARFRSFAEVPQLVVRVGGPAAGGGRSRHTCDTQRTLRLLQTA